MGLIKRVEAKNGKLTFVLKITQDRGRRTQDVALFCMTSLQAFRLVPTRSYWAKRYNNLTAVAMMGAGDIDTLEKLSEWCYIDNNRVISWEAVNRNWV